MERANICLQNLYKKDRTHPFFFEKDFEGDDCLNMNRRRLDGNMILFLMSVGEESVFAKIVTRTGYRYSCIKIADEYIGMIYPPSIYAAKSVECFRNDFIDFDTKGCVIAKFDISVKREKKKLQIGVAHFYNYGDERVNEIHGIGLLLTSYDPVQIDDIPSPLDTETFDLRSNVSIILNGMLFLAPNDPNRMQAFDAFFGL